MIIKEAKVPFDANKILENLPDPLILTDSQGRIVWLNQKAEEIFHVSCVEIQGLRFIEAINIYKIDKLIDDVLKSKEPSRSDYENATMLVEDHDIEYFFKIAVRPVIENDELCGTLIHLTDVTRFKKLEKMKTDFVSIVSHEFRTPLASITIGVGMLMEGILGNLNQKGKKIVSAIEEDCERLNTLINNLLDLSRMESGRIPMESEEVDVYNLVNEGVRLLSLQAESSGIKLKTDLKPGLPPVEADFNKAIWLLTNLLGNAIRYTHEGGTITVKARSAGSRLFISVIDTGCGIPRIYQKQIFSKFVQVKEAGGSKGGAGLGLAICQEVVEAHGGQIWVESIEGEGSTFTFTLPLATREANIAEDIEEGG